MIRINYITNLDIDNYSGGWSGMNHHVYNELRREFDINLIQKVDPPYSLTERIASKMFRLAGLEGKFPAFTNGRLNTIKENVERRLDDSSQYSFFHGSTPWLHVANKVPYAAYLDCCFASYIRVYHKQSDFSSRQLKHLFQQESKFLDGASNVFFSSKWALDDTRRTYKLTAHNFVVAGLGGGLEFEESGATQPKPYFLFIGMDFFGKGGDVAVEAFQEVKKQYPEFSLKIAGQIPPEKYKGFVEYEGVFDKSHNVQLKKLKALFAEAYCFVLPTSKDMTPLVLVEAASAGCPVIATDSFGIPEIVRNNETGILLDPALPLKEQLVLAMKKMIAQRGMRLEMAHKAPRHARNNFTWERTGKIIREKIFESLAAWK